MSRPPTSKHVIREGKKMLLEEGVPSCFDYRLQGYIVKNMEKSFIIIAPIFHKNKSFQF